MPLSHQDLASLIGATRESVTLTLGQLQEEKLLRVERRRLTVLDRGRLAAEAGLIESAPTGAAVEAPDPGHPESKRVIHHGSHRL